MSGDYDFAPRLGRINSQGKANTQLKRLKRVAATGRLVSRGRKTLAPGALRHAGRGKAQAALARHWSNLRARRIIVKVHIARAGPTGTASFSKHVAYIRREGAGREGERGQLYNWDQDEADAKAFNERASDDRRQFRLIVSPEDAEQIKDLTQFTREFMSEVEQDLGQRLDWVAANHHDTAQPHIHVVIRGGNSRNGELLIDRKYITHGFRARAQALVTLELGQRRLREIAAARSKDAERESLTAIDHDIAGSLTDGHYSLKTEPSGVSRFDRTVVRRRLRFLETFGLASRQDDGRWTLQEGWQDTLRALGRRGDIIRSLANVEGQKLDASRLHTLSRDLDSAGEILGRLAAILPGDELRNGKTVLLEGFDGRLWSIDLTEKEALQLPKPGGIVSVGRAAVQPKPADRKIAAISARHGGLYSEALHAGADPSSSPAFLLAHKRRLEALRRLGIVERNADGSWAVPAELEKLALQAEAKQQKLAINVHSWLPIETLVERRGETWLDKVDVGDIDEAGGQLSRELRTALQTRKAWLQGRGYLEQNGQLTRETAGQLKQLEIEAAGKAESARLGQSFLNAGSWSEFNGVYDRNLDLAQGRFAVISGRDSFVLIPASRRYSNWLGRKVTLSRSGRSLQWALARSRARGQ